MIEKGDLREWLFRGLMFEADAEKFRKAGLRVGADLSATEKVLFEEELRPFGVDLRNDALQMARLYSLIFCFENSVRTLITDRLYEKYQEKWYEEKVPKKIQEFIAKRQEEDVKNSWLEGQRTDPLSFAQFGHLTDIVINNWDDFSDLIPTQHWLKQRFDELEKSRNYIAHNRLLLPSEFHRIEMYISDWNNIVGL